MTEKTAYRDWPEIRGDNIVGEGEVHLDLFVDDDMACLAGHFPQNPVVPGVAQIHWAEHFARQYFADLMSDHGRFCGLEAIKFQSILQPKKTVVLKLTFNHEKHKLYFTYSDQDHHYSSGRLSYSAD